MDDIGGNKPSTKSTRRQVVNFEPSAKAQDFVKRVRAFMKSEIAPLEAAYWDKIEAQCNGREWNNWRIPPEMEALKSKGPRSRAVEYVPAR
jgi:hypothetical protein